MITRLFDSDEKFLIKAELTNIEAPTEELLE